MSHRKLLFFLPFLLCFPLLSAPLHAVEDGGIANLRQTSKAFASVAREVSPSVVFIQVESVQKGIPFSPFQSPFGDDLLNVSLATVSPVFPINVSISRNAG